MHRVLCPGGTAVIEDLARHASWADIDREVRTMETSRLSALVTKLVLATVLRRRAHMPAQLERLAAESPFLTCQVQRDGIGLRVLLRKSAG